MAALGLSPVDAGPGQAARRRRPGRTGRLAPLPWTEAVFEAGRLAGDWAAWTPPLLDRPGPGYAVLRRDRLQQAAGRRRGTVGQHVRPPAGHQPGDSPVTTARLASLDLAFNAYTTGLEEENPAGGGSLENVLTVGRLRPSSGASSPPTSSTPAYRLLPGALGPEAAAAWHTFTTNRLSVEISQLVNVAIVSGLNDRPPAFDNSAAISSIARSELEWSLSLPKLVLASSADLRAATAVQTRSSPGIFGWRPGSWGSCYWPPRRRCWP